MKVVEVETSLR